MKYDYTRALSACAQSLSIPLVVCVTLCLVLAASSAPASSVTFTPTDIQPPLVPWYGPGPIQTGWTRDFSPGPENHPPPAPDEQLWINTGSELQMHHFGTYTTADPSPTFPNSPGFNANQALIVATTLRIGNALAMFPEEFGMVLNWIDADNNYQWEWRNGPGPNSPTGLTVYEELNDMRTILGNVPVPYSAKTTYDVSMTRGLGGLTGDELRVLITEQGAASSTIDLTVDLTTGAVPGTLAAILNTDLPIGLFSQSVWTNPAWGPVTVAIPEPGTFALTGIGVMGMLLFGSRRRKLAARRA